MNARSQTFDLTMEGRQVDEAVSSIFHTILFHRSLGKFMYTGEAMYSIGSIGYMDVDCDFIDFTYVCCTSPMLDETIKREIGEFSRQLRSNESSGTGQISLEFFQRKKARFAFLTECIPWEVWTIRLELVNLTNEDDRQIYREQVGDTLSDKIVCITEIMNRHDYLPKTPNQTELDLVFDTSYPDVQPYLFQFKFTTTGPSTNSVGKTVKKLFKETLSL
ncbi:autophagy-related protein 101 [Aedes albopictus]|uniref:Autophagy-related protein 101 n=1 Tax=Aedes albopictus TaxID=7160 RepID=A0A182GTL4_AEDAL|nr:autophagy-related protein 101-like [Aedes albopictus]XP_029717710.1 autophagy-related protein 101-like isoform X4 [Aedes albopictus]QRG33458.1 autophagy related protein 101 [Aedes albopictus]